MQNVEKTINPNPIPDEFICPISGEKMTDPVIDEFGHTYDLQTITKWISSNNKSPLTNQEYTNTNFKPNFALKSLIEAYDKGETISLEQLPTMVGSLQLQYNSLSKEVGHLIERMLPVEIGQSNVMQKISNGALKYFTFWRIAGSVRTDRQSAVQNKLIDACFAGNVVEMRRLVIQEGARYDLKGVDGVLPLGAAVFGLNLKAFKEVAKVIKPDSNYIKECLQFNQAHYGSPIPKFKLVSEVSLRDFCEHYFSTGGRSVIFSDWITSSSNLNFANWVKLKEGNECIAFTRRLGQFTFSASDTKLIDLAKSGENRIFWEAFLSQYCRCEDAVKEMVGFLTLNLEDDLFNIVDYEKVIRNDDSDIKALQEQARIDKLLLHVTRGEQDEAEKMLKLYPHLVKGRGDITDYSGRKFLNITAFQYAIWALDWHMWKMLLKYLPENLAKSQLEEQPTVTLASGHGENYNFTPLIEAIKTYADNYDYWVINAPNLLAKQWAGKVSVAQRMVPAHVANEYCRPDRSFYPTPTFTESSLPRVLKKNDWNGDWWSAIYNNIHIGEDMYGVKGWAIHRGWAEGGPGPWEGGPPTGCINKKTAQTDYTAIAKLRDIRLQQLHNLKQSLLCILSVSNLRLCR